VALAAEGLAEQGAEDVFGADEVDADVVLTARKNSPANLRLGGFIGTHRVYNDVNRHQRIVAGAGLSALDNFFGCEDDATLVLAALFADTMG
jgi:hypothetical protein